jgi:hypothetical protein
MEKFIQEYLSTYYKIAHSEMGNAGIYDINKNSKYKAPESSKEILKEISQVFFLSEEDAKNQVELWAITIDPEVDLDFYWKSINELFFPTVSRVHARTIGMDLVSVQPMSAPRGDLRYFDSNRNIEICDDVRQVWENQLNELVGVSSRAFGEIDHPTDAIDALHYSILNSYTGRTDIY